MFSSIRWTSLGMAVTVCRCPQCTAEQAGYLVSADPAAGPEAKVDWACIVCQRVQAGTFVEAVTQVGTGNIPKHYILHQSIGEELVMLEKGSVEACQAFIKKHSQNLHPNHYYLQVRRESGLIPFTFSNVARTSSWRYVK